MWNIETGQLFIVKVACMVLHHLTIKRPSLLVNDWPDVRSARGRSQRWRVLMISSHLTFQKIVRRWYVWEGGHWGSTQRSWKMAGNRIARPLIWVGLFAAADAAYLVHWNNHILDDRYLGKDGQNEHRNKVLMKPCRKRRHHCACSYIGLICTHVTRY